MQNCENREIFPLESFAAYGNHQYFHPVCQYFPPSAIHNTHVNTSHIHMGNFSSCETNVVHRRFF